MRRTISRELKPASTNTLVPLATRRTALPVEPLPRTVSFISWEYYDKINVRSTAFKRKTKKKVGAIRLKAVLQTLNFQTRAIDDKAVQVTQRAERQRLRSKT